MIKWIRLFAIFFNCFAAVFCSAARKSQPLDPKMVYETIKALRQVSVECAFGFELSTKKGKKRETKVGKCYLRKASDVVNEKYYLQRIFSEISEKCYLRRIFSEVSDKHYLQRIFGEISEKGHLRKIFTEVSEVSKVSLLLIFNSQKFLFSGPYNDEIFCSDSLRKITPNDPVHLDHLLCFSDISMPFLEWSYDYLYPERVQGRNTHIFRFTKMGQVAEIAYDPIYKIILRVKHFDEKGKLLRIFNLLDLKKAQDTWFIKLIEIRDVPNNVTTQLIVKEVALGQQIPADTFDKNALGRPFVDRLIYTSL
ncbi:MAG: outer membrane lipoprotein-sorting protein [Puniceicoccales bacterium]|jgi:hypothetical protein|nr:outer membrane lipoprotein-sorting protein [Puniceicoccales bacterium]